jgi:hypothetical protein
MAKPELVKFTCASCNKEYFDTGLYFHDKPSKYCLWCGKYPDLNKTKKKAANNVVNIQQTLDK